MLEELEELFMRDPAFEDGVFVQSCVLMDFPFGPNGETALDYFEQFLDGMDDAPEFQPFIRAARGSRLGLHQDVMRTKKVAKFRELISGEVTEAFPSIEQYSKGEILLTRMMRLQHPDERIRRYAESVAAGEAAPHVANDFTGPQAFERVWEEEEGRGPA
jgi:hypothetical protein